MFLCSEILCNYLHFNLGDFLLYNKFFFLTIFLWITMDTSQKYYKTNIFFENTKKLTVFCDDYQHLKFGGPYLIFNH